jgi:hypothetical protein
MISNSRASAACVSVNRTVDRARLEHLLFGLGPEVEDGCQKVSELHRVLLRHHRHSYLGRDLRKQRESLLDHLLNISLEGFDLFFIDPAQRRQYLDACFQDGCSR